jgi:hypothetical protein
VSYYQALLRSLQVIYNDIYALRSDDKTQNVEFKVLTATVMKNCLLGHNAVWSVKVNDVSEDHAASILTINETANKELHEADGVLINHENSGNKFLRNVG